MKPIEVGDWIYWSSKEKQKKFEEPEQVVDVRTVIIVEHKRKREARLISTNKGSANYEHNYFFRYASEEEINMVKMKKMFSQKEQNNILKFLLKKERDRWSS